MDTFLLKLRKIEIINTYTVNTMFDKLYEFFISILTYLMNLFGMNSNLNVESQEGQENQESHKKPE